MNHLETAFLGSITLKLLHDLPVAQAGWLIHALAIWIVDGVEPEIGKVPAKYLGSWLAVREESINIHNARKARSDTRRNAALARWNADGCKPMQDDASECNAMQTDASRAPAKTKTKTETKIYTDDTADAVSSGPAVGGLRSAVSTSPISADGLKATNYTAWAAMQTDPVDVALDVTGEPPAKRRVYGARLKLLGRDRFLETVCTFRAEVEAGETVRNPGAALTAKLNEAVTAMEAVGGLAK